MVSSLAFALVGLSCSGASGPPPPDAGGGPPAIVARVEVANEGWDVPPGEEKTMCFFAEVDASETGGLAVVHYEAQMSEHSHHFNMAYLDRASGADLPRGLGDCRYGEYVPVYLAGSQWTEISEDLPGGMAIWIPDGAVLILEEHVVNATDAPVPASVHVRMDAIDPDLATDWIGVYFNQMRSIEVAAGTTQTLHARCPADEGTNVWLLTSHMHHFGDLFQISITDEASGTSDLVYESEDWAHPTILDRRNDPIPIGPGQGFEWSCRYTNPGPEPLVGGNSAEENEMCIMAAFYWPDRGRFQYCYAFAE
jgi:hypothetical protein